MSRKKKEKYTVDSNVPIPKGRKPCTKYPFDMMKKGDSFFVEVEVKSNSHSKRCSVMSSARKWASRNNVDHKYHSRTYTNGFRIWRVK